MYKTGNLVTVMYCRLLVHLQAYSATTQLKNNRLSQSRKAAMIMGIRVFE